MTHTKSEWRERLLRARRLIEPGTRRQASAAVVVRVAALPAYERARTLLVYVAIGAELDPAMLTGRALQSAKLVYRPATHDPPPRWAPIAPIGEERDAAADDLPPPVFLLVPGVGFDLHGGRLGRGRGFYDRVIATLRQTTDVTVVGAAYETQLVAALPQDPWDQCVDLVVTERRVVVADATVTRPLSARPSGGTR